MSSSTGFASLADVYNDTVRRDNTGTTALSGNILQEAWLLAAVLKMKQGVGEKPHALPCGLVHRVFVLTLTLRVH